MARVKWETMTDQSQAMVKKVGLISLDGVILLAFSKMIFPLVLLGGGSIERIHRHPLQQPRPHALGDQRREQ